MSKPFMKVDKDITHKVNELIKQFKRDIVLVGIPEDKSERSAGDQEMSNAALLALNTYGSPAQNIPPRPVMAIGLRMCQKELAAEFEKVASKTLAGRDMSGYYTKIGIIASNSIKKAINLQEGIAGPAESTLRSRKSKGFAGKKSLIVTGQMRNAITYVLKGGFG